MKNTSCFFVVSAAMLFLSAVVAAQTCTMVTYLDMQFDSSGKIVGTNYTSIGSSCGAQSAYAYVKLVMPDASSTSNSASGSYSATAVTLKNPTGAPLGSGTLEGTNYIVYPCIPPVASFFSRGFGFGSSQTWFQQSADPLVFDRMQPCPDPQYGVVNVPRCSGPRALPGKDAIQGTYLFIPATWVIYWGRTFCNPITTGQYSNEPPERPYCFDLGPF